MMDYNYPQIKTITRHKIFHNFWNLKLYLTKTKIHQHHSKGLFQGRHRIKMLRKFCQGGGSCRFKSRKFCQMDKSSRVKTKEENNH